MQLYLIRHGQSEGNIVTCDVPDGNLTPLGRAQAEETADHLVNEGIDLLIASPLRRALQTANALRRRTGIPLEVWRDLSEYRRLEPYRFLGKAGVQELIPEAICEDDLPDDGYNLGLESLDHVRERAIQTIRRLRERFVGTQQKVAIFAHGDFNSYFLTTLVGGPLSPSLGIEQRNCCINRALLEPHRIRLQSVNETWHLTQVT